MGHTDTYHALTAPPTYTALRMTYWMPAPNKMAVASPLMLTVGTANGAMACAVSEAGFDY